LQNKVICGNVIAKFLKIQAYTNRERNPGKERNQLSVKEVNAESLRDERSAYKKK
jgi:hypothetical protein